VGSVDERRRFFGIQIVQRRSVLAADLDDVAEPLGRHERGSRAAFFQKSVDRDSHRVAKGFDGSRLDIGVFAGASKALHNARALLVGCRYFGRRQLAVGQQNDVGERPANVNADDRWGRPTSHRQSPRVRLSSSCIPAGSLQST